MPDDWTNPLSRFQRYLQGMGTGLQQGVQGFLAPHPAQPQAIGGRPVSPELWNAWEGIRQYLPQGGPSLGAAPIVKLGSPGMSRYEEMLSHLTPESRTEFRADTPLDIALHRYMNKFPGRVTTVGGEVPLTPEEFAAKQAAEETPASLGAKINLPSEAKVAPGEMPAGLYPGRLARFEKEKLTDKEKARLSAERERAKKKKD